jgi:hypothetical protein
MPVVPVKPVGQLKEGVDILGDKIWQGAQWPAPEVASSAVTSSIPAMMPSAHLHCCPVADEAGNEWNEEGTTCLGYRKRGVLRYVMEKEEAPVHKRLRPKPGPDPKRPAVDDDDDEDLFGGCSSAH